MNYETWLANREERQGQHEDIDREEVREYHFSSYQDACIDGYTFPASQAFDNTLIYFQERGLTKSMLADIIEEP